MPRERPIFHVPPVIPDTRRQRLMRPPMSIRPSRLPSPAPTPEEPILVVQLAATMLPAAATAPAPPPNATARESLSGGEYCTPQRCSVIIATVRPLPIPSIPRLLPALCRSRLLQRPMPRSGHILATLRHDPVTPTWL